MLGSAIDEEVWELLKTPHTIVSLQRATSGANGGDQQPDPDHIETMLQRLLDVDLIELSPDS
jgi:hypothetical protein